MGQDMPCSLKVSIGLELGRMLRQSKLMRYMSVHASLSSEVSVGEEEEAEEEGRCSHSTSKRGSDMPEAVEDAAACVCSHTTRFFVSV